MHLELNLAELRELAMTAPGMWQACLGAGRLSGAVLVIEEDLWRGIQHDFHGRVRGLGDIIEKLAKPVAIALRLDCLDPAGNLKPDSGCAKRRAAANKLMPFRGPARGLN